MFSLMDMFFGSYAGDLAIDLGTANTLVSVRGKGRFKYMYTKSETKKGRYMVVLNLYV